MLKFSILLLSGIATSLSLTAQVKFNDSAAYSNNYDTMAIKEMSTTPQTNSSTITQSGWYRIAINGPLVSGSTGGDRAAARFILKDISGGLHQTVEFLAYIHYGKKPSIVVLNNSYFTRWDPPILKIRIVSDGIYSGAAIEVYVYVPSANPPRSNFESYFLQDNYQTSGWTAVDWQQISTSSGDQDGVSAGFTAYVINLKNIVNGFVTDGGKQQSYYNGNFYTSGNILLGKTTQTNSSYKLDVNGNIRANKVVVNTTGADHVFDSAYHLMSLDSLKNYVKEHQHLPEIQSANSMQIKGLDVGENQTKLLQKIEELTLYIIRQQYEIDSLKSLIIKELKNK